VKRYAAREYVTDGIVWDNHACMPLAHSDCSQMPALERCHESGIDIVSLNVASGEQTQAEAISMLGTFRSWIADRPDRFTVIATAADAVQARAGCKLGVCFDIEGMTALDGRLDMVERYYDLGVRWMLTAYNRGNMAGGGCLDIEDGGLTDFGRSVVREMNRVGMVVCGSHAGYRTARELIDASSEPIIFSHSNPRAVWDTPRNVPDDLMIACASRGGVVGLNGIGPFLGPNDVLTDTFVAHIEYVLDLIGEDHVGIALDYCFGQEDGMVELMTAYPELFPPGHDYSEGMKMIPPWRLGEIARSLGARGHGTSTLAKVFGENHLRIAKAVWR
jgi:membrane dipeptidase